MYCKECNLEKDDKEFPVNKSKSCGRGFYCNACMYARLKVWRSKNPEKVRVIQKRRYERLHGTKVCTDEGKVSAE